MSLERYWNKRDFKQTPEPRGKVARRAKKLSYYIQRHDARKLHYDFRLELDGTLKSWAIPKGPSLDPADKRLAVHVEDHPMDYGTFEGEIPAHQYGAGTVLLWDRGIWTPDDDPEEGYRKGRLKFHLDGEKLTGGWMLVRMGPPKDEKENWLLIKEDDEASRTGSEALITDLRPESVADRTTGKKPGRSGRHASGSRSTSAAPTHEAPTEGAVEARMPDFINPQLATLAEHAPGGKGWLSEVKFDGYRILTRIDHGDVQLFTRAGNNWTSKWPALTEMAKALPVEQAWLDGELVAIANDGSIRFQALQNSIQNKGDVHIAYYVFDLVYLNGFDLMHVPLIQRKAALKELIATLGDGTPILYNDHLDSEANDVFDHACMHGMEGIIVKRADGHYQQERSSDWLKIKCLNRQEFVIGGYTDPAGTRDKFGALLLGVHDEDGGLRYAGRVGTGFDRETLHMLADRFLEYKQAQMPFSAWPKGLSRRGIHWLKPKLVAEVKFTEWTDDGLVRQASFVGLRSDKPQDQVVRETAISDEEVSVLTRHPAKNPTRPGIKHGKGDPAIAHQTKESAAQKASSRPDRGSGTSEVAGITLSHSSRVLFSAADVTKLDLAHYYERVADLILPHLSKRPLTLVRCPHGAQCFFQKHVTDATAEDIDRVDVPEESGTATYMMANSLKALIALVQMGVLELHTWGSREGSIDKPDRMIFDLDPAPDVAWTRVIEGAQLVRALLEDIGLTSFVKTTGGKGLHVVVPLKPERSWDEVKAFSRAIAEHLAHTLPDHFVANMAKAKRGGKIFVDYLRNGSGATAVAAFSTRAKPDAPLSVPIGWDELSPDLHSDSFTVTNIGTRLKNGNDPWAEYFKLKQRITAKMTKIFGSA